MNTLISPQLVSYPKSNLSHPSAFYSKPRKLPPYGKALLNDLQQGKQPNNGLWLFTGPESWQRARHFYRCGKVGALVLPEQAAPEEFTWPVSNLSVLIFDSTSKGLEAVLLKRLAYELLIAGADIVRALLTRKNAEMTVFYRDGTRQTRGTA